MGRGGMSAISIHYISWQCNAYCSFMYNTFMYQEIFLSDLLFASLYSKKETCLKTDSGVSSEEISLKQDYLSSKSSTLCYSTLEIFLWRCETSAYSCRAVELNKPGSN